VYVSLAVLAFLEFDYFIMKGNATLQFPKK